VYRAEWERTLRRAAFAHNLEAEFTIPKLTLPNGHILSPQENFNLQQVPTRSCTPFRNACIAELTTIACFRHTESVDITGLHLILNVS
jgi:hypothetical protein